MQIRESRTLPRFNWLFSRGAMTGLKLDLDWIKTGQYPGCQVTLGSVVLWVASGSFRMVAYGSLESTEVQKYLEGTVRQLGR